MFLYITQPMKTQYRVKEYKGVKNASFEAQYKPWWFPFAWFSCYGIHLCCYYESAKQICEFHRSGRYFTEDEINWVANATDVFYELNGTRI